MKKSGIGVAILLLPLFFLATNLVFIATIYAQSPFYQGKSIRLIAGTQAGSLADLWPRLIADHMGTDYRSKGDSIRLGEIQLDRHAGAIRLRLYYARG
jgi:hypothetical protein